MICVAKSPRRLFYKWTTWGVEIEYPSDIPTPTPEIVCNTVQVTVPLSLPRIFDMWAIRTATGQYFNSGRLFSYSLPWIQQFTWGGSCYHYLWGTNQFGQVVRAPSSSFAYRCNTAYFTPGIIQQPRRDLLVGSDRIINPTINTPCPTWRLAGGICPPDTIPCDDECMPCDSLVARIEALMV